MSGQNIQQISQSLLIDVKQKGNPILLLRDIDFTVDDASIEKTIMLDVLKTIIASGTARFIFTMNASNYRKFLSREQSLAKLFEIVKVAEPSGDLTIQILKSVAVRLSGFHNIQIPEEILTTCVTLAQRYIQDAFLPLKAINLLDETCSKASSEGKTTITAEDVRSVISEKTGIPIEKLTVSEQKKLVNLEETLNKKVVGQKPAVHVVSEVIRRNRVGLKDPKKPVGSFLFLGPSGVGKTYLAKNLTKIVYDNEKAMIRIDMSEFSESHTVQRLIGSPPGYVGYDEGGQLTNPVWEQPYSLILLDEIEKAHPKVFDIFLQVLDEGHLTDGQGRTVDFKNTIIIATSNVASDQILQKIEREGIPEGGFEREQFYENEILPLLREYFRPEFINRFDEVVIFNPLSVEQLQIIGKLQVEKIQQRLIDKKIELHVSDEKLHQLAEKAYNPSFGARPMIRLIQEQIENVIAGKILSGEIKKGETVQM
jgi:ATP-dependent Clp protease ATP-binding subunit ClpC